MKSAGNEGIVHGRLQMLHVHVFLAAPLGARHMAQPRTDQHQGGVAIGECPHHPRPSTDLTVQPLDHVVGADARLVFTGKVTVRGNGTTVDMSALGRFAKGEGKGPDRGAVLLRGK